MITSKEDMNRTHRQEKNKRTEDNKRDSLLRVENLSVFFRQRKSSNCVVKDLSFEVRKGEILGIVGESGSGKTMTALSIMGLLQKNARVEGNIYFQDINLPNLREEQFRKIKGKEISMIFQEPMTSLNPLMTIGEQLDEMIYLHDKKASSSNRREKVLEGLGEAGLNSQSVYDKYPHQLSGGMRQRAMIAMAMLHKPALLIADEPTTALDVTIQAQILKLIKQMNEESGTAVILISHDLGVIKSICDRVLVMKDGIIVEEGSIKEIFENPQNDYTKLLLDSVPTLNNQFGTDINTSLHQKEHNINNDLDNGTPKDAGVQRKSICNKLKDSNPILTVKDLDVFYEDSNRGNFKKTEKNQILKKVSLQIKQGECFGIVGESGSGKSTLAKAILGLVTDYKGEISLADSHPQMVFQDPYGSLNPSKKVGWILEEPLRLRGKLSKEKRVEKVYDILKRIGLNKDYGNRYLYQLSGGQRQRVAIGVALIQESKFIILDEPVSALDVTVQAQILKLLMELKEEYGLSYLFISHDLKVVNQMCERVGVMKEGEIVENTTIEKLFNQPTHPYTKKLLEAVL